MLADSGGSNPRRLDPPGLVSGRIGFYCDTGVIKFWGPHENGDPGVPILSLEWGPLHEIGDPQYAIRSPCSQRRLL